jgi:hypothetical protein
VRSLVLFLGLPQGHGRAPGGEDPRPEQWTRELHAEELPVGYPAGAGTEPEELEIE